MRPRDDGKLAFTGLTAGRYEDALRDIIKRKAAGEKISPVAHPKPKATTNLKDAPRASLEGTQKRPVTVPTLPRNSSAQAMLGPHNDGLLHSNQKGGC
jgi:non-homologous end joining protein Ku